MTTSIAFYEKTTPVITGWFKDGNTPIGIEELKVTIYDSETKEIINSRDNQDLTGSLSDFVNGTTGAFEFALTQDDTTIVRPNTQPGDIIEHIVRFDYKWDTLTKANSTVIALQIKNMDHK